MPSFATIGEGTDIGTIRAEFAPKPMPSVEPVDFSLEWCRRRKRCRSPTVRGGPCLPTARCSVRTAERSCFWSAKCRPPCRRTVSGLRRRVMRLRGRPRGSRSTSGGRM